MFTIKSILSAAALTGVLVTAGCAGGGVRVGFRAYDPYRADYHVWDGNEGAYYTRWTVETHRDSHRDFRRLRKNEQEEYWRWRHAH